jgi:hypothetical protein
VNKGIGALAVVGILFVIALIVVMLSNPDPARHYDAEYGVMCYTIPGAISCVKAP